MKSPRSPRCVRTPTLMTIPEHTECSSSSDSSAETHFSKSHPDFNNNNNNSTIEEDPVRLIQAERSRCRLPALTRDVALDSLAVAHALSMAHRCTVDHSVSCVAQLKRAMQSDIVGENVQRGDSIHTMHFETMCTEGVNRSNVHSKYFTHIGSAVVKGQYDGKLYTCQLFRG